MALTGCGGGGGGSSNGDAQIRVVNMTHQHDSIDLMSGGSSSSLTRSITKVARGAASTYVTVAAGSYTLQPVVEGSTTALATTSPTLSKDQKYVLFVYESAGSVRVSLLGENDTAPSAGASALRAVTVAGDAGAVDVYVVPAAGDFASATVSFTFSASSSLQSTATQSFAPGSYKVRVTSSGNRSDVRLEIPALTLGDQQTQQLVLTPTIGGGLVDASGVVEKGDFKAYTNDKARVRIVSGAPSGQVAASVAGQTVEAGAQSPSIGSYVLVPSGSAAWTVTVGGNAAAVPAIALTAGSDNTLLVTGTAASSAVTLLVDDNHLPSLSSNVNLRLINSLANSNAGLTLTVDFSQVATNVLPGATSGYKAVAGDTNMRLEVTSALSAQPISLQSGLNIPGGGVYSIFVLGDAATPITSVRRDR